MQGVDGGGQVLQRHVARDRARGCPAAARAPRARGERSCSCSTESGSLPLALVSWAAAAPQLLLSVTHIGPRRARRLVDGLGEDWIALLDADPVRAFATLRGMGRGRAQIAARSWRRTRENQRAPDLAAVADNDRVG